MTVLTRLVFFDASARWLGMVRVAAGAYATIYLAVRAPHFIAFGRFDPDRFDPVGVVAIVRDSPLSSGVVTMLVLVTIAFGVAFTLGYRFAVTGLAFALMFLWITSYRNSWGLVLHTENLVTIHLLILSVAPADDGFAVGRTPTTEPHWRYGWPLRAMVLAVLLGYFVSGWSKVTNGGWEWLVGDALRNQIAQDNLRKLLLGDFYSPLGGWLTAHAGWAFKPMALLTMVVELSAPLMFLKVSASRLWAAATWMFHVGVLTLMAIVFPYQLLGLAFLPFFDLERQVDTVLSRVPGRRLAEMG